MLKKKVAIPIYDHKELIFPEAREILANAGFEIVSHNTGEPIKTDEFKEIIRDAYAAIAGVEVYSKEILDAAENLKVIARYGVGLDNIDLDECRRRGIHVTCTDNRNAVAEFALTLILSVLKNIPWYDSVVRKTNWNRKISRELTGKTVGLIGFGKISRKLSQLLSGFNVNIYAYDPVENRDAAQKLGVEFKTFEEVLAKSDIISLHLPYNDKTHHLIGEKEISLMKDGAYFINTARGPIVNETALYDALLRGKLAGAGLDVYETEPVKADNLLLSLPNVVLSPHVAAASFETNYNGSLICARSIVSISKGEKPPYLVF